MKYISFVAIVCFLSSCMFSKKGSGNIVTNTRTVSAFTDVAVSTSIDVDVQQGAETSVIVEADDNIINLIETKVVNGELKIGLKGGTNIRNATLKVHVVSPLYKSFSSSSSSEIIGKTTITSLNKINVKASSSSKIELQLEAPSIEVKASSSADIDVEGRTKDLNVDASSSASIIANNLKAENVTAEASSSSDISIFASVKLQAKATSSADIIYTGGVVNAEVKTSSSGTITKQ
jgi:Putative auto-transporter adhesin, head GIN domain